MYQYNQTKHVKHILKNGFSKRFMSMELKLLALHYRDLGKSPKERKELLYSICEKHVEGFNRVKFFKAINSAVNYSTNKKNKLIDVPYIPVTRSEILYIDNLDLDVFYKKILFTFIVMDKLNKVTGKIKYGRDPNGEHYFKNNVNRHRELVKTSGITSSMFKKHGHHNIHGVIHYFIELGLVEDTIENIKLLFIYDIPDSNDIEMKITDFENIGMYYDLHIGKKNIKACESCGKPIKVRSNRTKYCSECAEEKERIRKREWKRNNGSDLEN